MKHNQTEKAERLFTALGDLDPKTVASAAAYKPQATRKGSGRRILVAVLAATLCVCLVTLTVFAAVPSLRGMLNLPFLSESERQTTVPEGYNALADVLFTISAAHEETSVDPKLLTLDGGLMGTGDITVGTITKDIVNQTGTVLPETGAAGTMMLICGGAMFVMIAGVFMITRKKMSIFED